MFDDFRSFIERLSEVGEVRRIEGADWNLEIRTIAEVFVERRGPELLEAVDCTWYS